ncbi:hypothetical protein V8B97DRAFT_1867046, partial [Scleroderma yunnanense]
LQLQQAESYCKERCQHNENMNSNLPGTHGLLLEGEWTDCASSKARDPTGSTNNMSIDEEEATIQTAEECCQQLGTMNGDPDHEAEHMDIQNKLDELIIMSMEPEDNNSNMTMCVHLGGPHWYVGSMNGPGSQTDGSRSRTDGLTGQMHALDVSNSSDTDRISHDDGIETYLDTGDVGGCKDEANDFRCHTSALSRCLSTPSKLNITKTPCITAREHQNMSRKAEDMKLTRITQNQVMEAHKHVETHWHWRHWSIHAAECSN